MQNFNVNYYKTVFLQNIMHLTIGQTQVPDADCLIQRAGDKYILHWRHGERSNPDHTQNNFIH